jgi:ribosomal protein S18 acetylase RimI-like enzyme
VGQEATDYRNRSATERDELQARIDKFELVVSAGSRAASDAETDLEELYSGARFSTKIKIEGQLPSESDMLGVVSVSKRIAESSGIVQFGLDEFKLVFQRDLFQHSQIYKLNGEVLGYLAVAAATTGPGEQVQVYIYNFGILPESTGRGIGTSMLHDLAEKVTNSPFFGEDEWIYLEVEPFNTQAIELYEKKLGFERKGSFIDESGLSIQDGREFITFGVRAGDLLRNSQTSHIESSAARFASPVSEVSGGRFADDLKEYNEIVQKILDYNRTNQLKKPDKFTITSDSLALEGQKAHEEIKRLHDIAYSLRAKYEGKDGYNQFRDVLPQPLATYAFQDFSLDGGITGASLDGQATTRYYLTDLESAQSILRNLQKELKEAQLKRAKAESERKKYYYDADNRDKRDAAAKESANAYVKIERISREISALSEDMDKKFGSVFDRMAQKRNEEYMKNVFFPTLQLSGRYETNSFNYGFRELTNSQKLIVFDTYEFSDSFFRNKPDGWKAYISNMTLPLRRIFGKALVSLGKVIYDEEGPESILSRPTSPLVLPQAQAPLLSGAAPVELPRYDQMFRKTLDFIKGQLGDQPLKAAITIVFEEERRGEMEIYENLAKAFEEYMRKQGHDIQVNIVFNPEQAGARLAEHNNAGYRNVVVGSGSVLTNPLIINQKNVSGVTSGKDVANMSFDPTTALMVATHLAALEMNEDGELDPKGYTQFSESMLTRAAFAVKSLSRSVVKAFKTLNPQTMELVLGTPLAKFGLAELGARIAHAVEVLTSA